MTGITPFEDAKNEYQLKELILNRDIDFSLIKNSESREVIENILNKDPIKRWTLNEIIKSNWVTKNGKDKLNIEIIEEDIKFGNINRLTKER